MMKRILHARVTSDEVAVRLVQYACFSASGVIPILAFRRLAELDLSATQLLIAVLSTMSTALLFAVLGLLLATWNRSPKRTA